MFRCTKRQALFGHPLEICPGNGSRTTNPDNSRLEVFRSPNNYGYQHHGPRFFVYFWYGVPHMRPKMMLIMKHLGPYLAVHGT